MVKIKVQTGKGPHTDQLKLIYLTSIVLRKHAVTAITFVDIHSAMHQNYWTVSLEIQTKAHTCHDHITSSSTKNS